MEVVLNENLRVSLQGRKGLLGDLGLIEALPTVEELCVYPDVAREPLGIGFPVGVSVRTAGRDAYVFPTAVTDVNDGYRLVRTDLTEAELASRLPRVLESLACLKTRREPLPPALARGILSEGVSALPHDPSQRSRIWRQGGTRVEPGAAPPWLCDLTANNFGSFGHYGHFLELLVVDDPHADSPLGQGTVCLLIHGGGMSVSDEHHWSWYFRFADEALEHVSEEHYLAGMFGLPRSHPVAQQYAREAQAISNLGYAWRHYVSAKTLDIISDILGRPVAGDLVSDTPHNRLEESKAGVFHAKGVQPLATPAAERTDDFTSARLIQAICLGFGMSSVLIEASDPSAAHRGVSHGAAHAHRPRAGVSVSDEHLQILSALVTNHELPQASGLSLRLAVQNAIDTVDTFTALSAIKVLAGLRPVLNFSGDRKPNLASNRHGKDLLLYPSPQGSALVENGAEEGVVGA